MSESAAKINKNRKIMKYVQQSLSLDLGIAIVGRCAAKKNKKRMP
jgi:hypothetical protein